jgi:hypothetical protein
VGKVKNQAVFDTDAGGRTAKDANYAKRNWVEQKGAKRWKGFSNPGPHPSLSLRERVIEFAPVRSRLFREIPVSFRGFPALFRIFSGLFRVRSGLFRVHSGFDVSVLTPLAEEGYRFRGASFSGFGA